MLKVQVKMVMIVMRTILTMGNIIQELYMTWKGSVYAYETGRIWKSSWFRNSAKFLKQCLVSIRSQIYGKAFNGGNDKVRTYSISLIFLTSLWRHPWCMRVTYC